MQENNEKKRKNYNHNNSNDNASNRNNRTTRFKRKRHLIPIFNVIKLYIQHCFFFFLSIFIYNRIILQKELVVHYSFLWNYTATISWLQKNWTTIKQKSHSFADQHGVFFYSHPRHLRKLIRNQICLFYRKDTTFIYSSYANYIYSHIFKHILMYTHISSERIV